MSRALAAAAVVAAAACHASPAPTPTGPPTCARAADHVQALLPPADDHGAHAKQVRDVLQRRCEGDHWAVEVIGCMLDESELHAGHHCQDKLTADQRTAFTREVAEIDAPADLSPREARGRKRWPPACIAYAQAVGVLASCPRIPEEARDAMEESFDQASAGWDSLPDDILASLAASCQAAGDAVRQMSSGQGCR